MPENNEEITELLSCRYKCAVCQDIIESNGALVKCACGSIAVDARPGPVDMPRRRLGKPEHFIDLCIWRTNTGRIVNSQNQTCHMH